MKAPDQVNICGILYKVEYKDNPADVDTNKRMALWGSIDYWTRTIRIYRKGRAKEDIWYTIFHEVLHGISNALNLDLNDDENHDTLDLLALALTDVLFRNDWIKIDDSPSK